MICAAPPSPVWRWSVAPKRRSRRLPDTAFATYVRSSMHIICIVIRHSPRPQFESWKLATPNTLARPKPERIYKMTDKMLCRVQQQKEEKANRDNWLGN